MNRLDQTSREYWRGVLVAGGFTAIPRWAVDPAAGVAEHEEMISDDLVAELRRMAGELTVSFGSVLLTAHAKVLNFTSNFGSLVLFIIGGKVLWGIGLVMLVGQVLGARLGAHMVMTRGQKLIRPMIVIVSLVMSCKLLYDNHGAEIQQWLALHF